MDNKKAKITRRLTLTMHEENEIKESKLLMNSLIVDANVYKQEREILQDEYKEKKLEYQDNVQEIKKIKEQSNLLKKKKKDLEKVKKEIEKTPLQQFKAIKSVQKNYDYVILLLEAYAYLLEKQLIEWSIYKTKIDVKNFRQNVLSLNPENIKKQQIKILKDKFFDNQKWNIERMKTLPLYHLLAKFLQLLYKISKQIKTFKPQKRRLSVLNKKVQQFEDLQQSQVKDFNSIVRKEKGTYQLLNAFKNRIKSIIKNSQTNQKNQDEILYDKNNFEIEIYEEQNKTMYDKECQTSLSQEKQNGIQNQNLFEYINSEDEEISLTVSQKKTIKKELTIQTFSHQLQLSKNNLFQKKTFDNDNSTENFSQRLSYFEKDNNEQKKESCQIIVDVMNQSDSQIDPQSSMNEKFTQNQKRSVTSDLNVGRKKDQYVSYLFVHSKVTKDYWKDQNSFFHMGDSKQDCFYRKLDPKLVKNGQYKQPESYKEEIFRTGRQTLHDKVTRVSNPVYTPRLSENFINHSYQPKNPFNRQLINY